MSTHSETTGPKIFGSLANDVIKVNYDKKLLCFKVPVSNCDVIFVTTLALGSFVVLTNIYIQLKKAASQCFFPFMLVNLAALKASI